MSATPRPEAGEQALAEMQSAFFSHGYGRDCGCMALAQDGRLCNYHTAERKLRSLLANAASCLAGCPVRDVASHARIYIEELVDAQPQFLGANALLKKLEQALATPCAPAVPEPSEAAIDAGIVAEYDHASHMENDATRCVCACGAIFDNKPELDADDQQRRHWLRETLRAAYAVQFSPPERGTAAPKEEDHGN